MLGKGAIGLVRFEDKLALPDTREGRLVPSSQHASDLIRAVAELFKALQWPLVALIISFFFRSDIRKLFQRMKKGEFLGAKAEFESTLEQLEEGTADETIGKTAEASTRPSARLTEAELSRDVRKLAANSPREALMLLSSQIERTIHDLVYYYRGALEHPMSDALFAYKFRSMEVCFDLLLRVGAINERILENLTNFLRIRSMVIQEGFGDDSEIRRAIDSGLKIYADLQTRFLAPPP